MTTQSVIQPKPSTFKLWTVYVDVDGVLLDYNKLFVDHWNEGIRLGIYTGKPINYNPSTWTFGLTPEDDQTELDRATWIFHDIHPPLPLLHEGVVDALKYLYTKFNVEILSSYPDLEKRKQNLDMYGLLYHNIHCGVSDKLAHIKAHEESGNHIVCIFEDGPHHLDKLLPVYGNKIWSPSQWNYLNSYKDDKRIRFYSDPKEWFEL